MFNTLKRNIDQFCLLLIICQDLSLPIHNQDRGVSRGVNKKAFSRRYLTTRNLKEFRFTLCGEFCHINQSAACVLLSFLSKWMMARSKYANKSA